jgi:hypothetical protein
MTDDEAKALALVKAVLTERNLSDKRAVRREVSPYTEALCRAIEQHEAFKQEVSDAVEEAIDRGFYAQALQSLIIPAPKPDPLVEAMADCGVDRFESWADQLRAALEARGLEIREKANDD